jgi:hypothetical protein
LLIPIGFSPQVPSTPSDIDSCSRPGCIQGVMLAHAPTGPCLQPFVATLL